MAKSLIRKNQLHPDIADLISGYGDDFFITENELNQALEVFQNVFTAGAVLVSGDQNISGLKNFITRPTINGTGVLLSGEAVAGNISNVVYTTGDQSIGGTKTFTGNFNITGSGIIANVSNGATLQLSGYRVLTTNDPITATATGLPDTIVYTTGDQNITGIKNFQSNVKLNTINGNTSFGIYNYNLSNSYNHQYLRQGAQLSGLANTVSGIRNKDIVNFYFGDVNPNVLDPKFSLKVNPGVLVDHNNHPSNRNLVKFPDNSIYSGKAIRKVRYNSTIGNGYERINLTNLSVPSNPATIRPLTRRLETFYDISVPSGGGVRALYFNLPTSPNFVQGLCMNLRFNFEADNTPCVISGYSTFNQIFLITGANYNFVQKERVILINRGTVPYYEFIHW